MPAYTFRGLTPVVHPTAYVHPTAVLIGDVIIGPHCFIGPHASLRADIGQIIIHHGTNIQDNCTLHCFPGKKVLIEEAGHIGHAAILHSCTIKKYALVGMQAIIMDDSIIGENSLIAAKTFIKANTRIPPNSLAQGIPGKIVRQLTPNEIHWQNQGTKVYQDLAQQYLKSSHATAPLTEIEPDRPTLPHYQFQNKHEQSANQADAEPGN